MIKSSMDEHRQRSEKDGEEEERAFSNSKKTMKLPVKGEQAENI